MIPYPKHRQIADKEEWQTAKATQSSTVLYVL